MRHMDLELNFLLLYAWFMIFSTLLFCVSDVPRKNVDNDSCPIHLLEFDIDQMKE